MQGDDSKNEKMYKDQDDLNNRNKTTILVCVDFQNQIVRSYDL
jgi:hypothetical protein